MAFQRWVNNGLRKVLNDSSGTSTTTVDGQKFVIFSDLHRGAKDRADNFKQSESTYTKALKYYLDNGYTLVLAGDIEDLWEAGIRSVKRCYPTLFALEDQFREHGRYVRIVGNHDNFWEVAWRVRKFLGRDVRVQRGFVVTIPMPGNPSLRVFVAHGHQGTLTSYYLAGLAVIAVRVVWRTLEFIFGGAVATPAKSFRLRARHDRQMYRWACSQERLILVAGHTHRPVWGSRTHLERLVGELRHLQSKALTSPSAKLAGQIQDLREEVNHRLKDDPGNDEIVRTRPCYFNSGTATFSDGDITAIEIDAQHLALVKWEAGATSQPVILEQSSFGDIYPEVLDPLQV